MHEKERVIIVNVLEVVPSAKQQAVLDEFAGARKKGAIKSGSWTSWLRATARNAAHGDFELSHGLDIALDRERRAKEAKEYATARAAAVEQEKLLNDPLKRERLEAASAQTKAVFDAIYESSLS